MQDKSNKKNKERHFQMPRLRLRYRLLLYFFMLVFITLSMISVILDCFPEIASIGCYVLAAVTLAAGGYYLVIDIGWNAGKAVRSGVVANPYVSRVVSDYRLRTVVFAVPGVVGNVLYAVFNGVTGVLSHSAWFGTLSAYYILLSIMRIGAVRQAGAYLKISSSAQENSYDQRELSIYFKDSILFLFLAVTLAGMVILLELSAGGKTYPGLTIYATAAYTFYRIIISVINLVKVSKRRSPLLVILRKIGYVDACVSILILQTALLSAFSQETEEGFVRLMNGITGGVVCAMIFGIGVQGIYSSKKMKERNRQ